MSNALRYGIAAVGFVLLETVLILFVDKPLSQYMHGLDACAHGLVDFFRAYTNLGKSLWYLWPSGLGAIACWAYSRLASLPKEKRATLLWVAAALGFIFACVALSGIVADAIKPLIGRARPVMLERYNLYGMFPLTFDAAYYSLPSGHATTAFALAVALMALFPRWRIPLLAYAVAIALSRVMVNAHFLADVLAGSALGTLTSLALQRVFTRYKIVFARDGDIAPAGRRIRQLLRG